MTNELFFFIILVLILLYFLPERKHSVVNRMEKRKKVSNISNKTNEYDENNLNLEFKKDKDITNNKITMELINDYLSETKCEEGFEMMRTFDPYNNTQGNNMAFYPQIILPSNKLDKALDNSLVPDFEPSALNINAELNSFGYATNNPNEDNYYMSRGFINPTDGYQYANSVQYNLAHPYQTRYCDK